MSPPCHSGYYYSKTYPPNSLEANFDRKKYDFPDDLYRRLLAQEQSNEKAQAKENDFDFEKIKLKNYPSEQSKFPPERRNAYCIIC